MQPGGRSLPFGDVLLGLVLAVLVVVEVWVQPVFQTGLPGPRPVVTAGALLAVAPVVVRRRRPVLAVVAGVAGLLLLGVVAEPEQAGFPVFVAALVLVWTVAAQCQPLVAARALGAVLAAGALYEALTFVDGDTGADVAVPLLLLIAAWGAGSEVRRHRDAVRRTEERAAAALREQERVLQQERDEIARELHDVVAAALSVVGVQAAAASRADAEGARAAAATIERVSRAAVLDMRRLLQVLRRPGGTALEAMEPLPGAAALDGVLAEAQDAGLELHAAVDDGLAALPAVLQLTVVRIVQESLTNVRKHSGASACWVSVRIDPSAVEVDVEDDGRGSDAPVPGHGLVGMAERARLVDGTVEVGRSSHGGLAVRACMPAPA